MCVPIEEDCAIEEGGTLAACNSGMDSSLYLPKGQVGTAIVPVVERLLQVQVCPQLHYTVSAYPALKRIL